MDSNGVEAALELVIEESKALHEKLRQAAIHAIEQGEYEKGGQLTMKCNLARKFLEKVEQLRKEWQALRIADTRVSQRLLPQRGRSKHSVGRLPRGMKTPEEAFRRPILEALVELGGRATVSEVLSRVERKMAHTLNDYDWQLLSSNKAIRWKNTAQWCRNTMVQEGLLRYGDDLPKGIWEISDAGRKALESGEV